MAEYIRARSSKQKQERMQEIMQVTDRLFETQTYHAITLTTIAAELGWSRGNLYKYVTTREEIFLQLYLEKQCAYFEDLTACFRERTELSDEDFAQIWAACLDRHHDYLKYYGILATIIETNVTLERLVDFKKNVMNGIDAAAAILKNHCSISQDEACELFFTFLYHATGLNNGCTTNPTILKAMQLAGIKSVSGSFSERFCKFIVMCLRQQH